MWLTKVCRAAHLAQPRPIMVAVVAALAALRTIPELVVAV